MSVAIVGGGVAGLACAGRLSELGLDVQLFNTGRRGVGGLLATRSFPVVLEGNCEHVLHVDTAAQLFSASHPRFLELCKKWEMLGWVRRWEGSAVRLREGGDVENLPQNEATPVYVAVDGMEALANHIADDLRVCGVNIRTQIWVSSAERTPDARWDIKWDLWSMGVTDYVVCAHSGKCAKRLTSARGLERCHSVVKQVELGVVWCLAVAFSESLKLSFDVALIENSREIAWASNQTAKLKELGSGMECWVILSTNTYGWRHKVPQEFVPPAMLAAVSEELLTAFQNLIAPLRSTCTLPKIEHQHAQLWGAGLPTKVLEDMDMFFDPIVRAGVCADWCVAPCIEGGALSGLQLADAIAEHHSRGSGTARASCPSYATLRPFRTACEIAAFPGWLDPPTQLMNTIPSSGSAVQFFKVDPLAPIDTNSDLIGSSAHSSPNDCRHGLQPRRSRWTGARTSNGLVARPLDRSLSENDGTIAGDGECAAERGLPATSRQFRRWKRHSGEAAIQEEQTSGDGTSNDLYQNRPETIMDTELLRPLAHGKNDSNVELQPGLIVLRNSVSAKAQQWLADEVMRLGSACSEEVQRVGHSRSRPSRVRSSGLYRTLPGGEQELNVQSERRGSFVRLLSDCKVTLEELCMQCFARASELSAALPEMNAKVCVFNFYEEDSPGLRWHRDIDETSQNLRDGQGRPVVSVSIGDDCTFAYRPQRFDDEACSLRLRSGDVVVFGGPSRGIPHAVTEIHPHTRPACLRMPRGRINLTFRHHA